MEVGQSSCTGDPSTNMNDNHTCVGPVAMDYQSSSTPQHQPPPASAAKYGGAVGTSRPVPFSGMSTRRRRCHPLMATGQRRPRDTKKLAASVLSVEKQKYIAKGEEDRPRLRETFRLIASELPFHAEQCGPCVVLRNTNEALRLFRAANFGQFSGQRMNFPNAGCFDFENDKKAEVERKEEELAVPNGSSPDHHSDSVGEEGEEEVDEDDEEPMPATGRGMMSKGVGKTEKAEERWKTGREWIENCSGNAQLYLNPLEALYLMYDAPVIELRRGGGGGEWNNGGPVVAPEQFYLEQVRMNSGFFFRYVVYRYLQQLGWTVTEGLQFAVDFLIYKDSVELYHSSAGVKILYPSPERNSQSPCSALTSLCSPNIFFDALQRALKGCKKVLLLAEVVLPWGGGLDFTDIQSLKRVLEVRIHSADSWFAKRSRTFDLDPKEKNEA